jgi:hypothetical protein
VRRLMLAACGPEVVRSAFSALLGRFPEDAAVRHYVEGLGRPGRLEEVLREIAQSEEAWGRTLERRAPEVVVASLKALLGKDVDPNQQTRYSLQLAESKDITAFLNEIVALPLYGQRLVTARADAVVCAAFEGLLGREPDAEALSAYVGKFSEGLELAQFLSEIAASREHWQKQISANAPEIVRAAFAGFLMREAEPEVLRHHVDSLAERKDLSFLFSSIVNSQEHWECLLAANAQLVVQGAFEGLLGRMPDPEAAKTYSEEFAENKKIAALLAAVAGSKEHWAKQVSTNAETVIRQVFDGLLMREPGAEELARHREELVAGGSISDLVRAVDASSDRWGNLLENHAKTLIREFYRALLGRDPDEEGIEHHSKVLASNGSPAFVLQNILASEEYEERCDRQLADRLKAQVQLLVSAHQSFGFWAAENTRQLASTRCSLDVLKVALYGFVPELAQREAYHAANPLVRYTLPTLLRLESDRKLALIFVPTDGWLPFGLAVADQLKSEEECETVFVWETWSPTIAQAVALSTSVFDSVSLTDLGQLNSASRFSPCVIVAHSFGWIEQTTSLLRQFPKAALMIYADGYKNEASPILENERAISGGYFFGFYPTGRKVRARKVISAEIVNGYFDRIANLYAFQRNLIAAEPKEEYAAVYLRYWGFGPYAFSIENAARVMADTITRGVETHKNIVIKHDRRVHPELYPLLSRMLMDIGYRTCELGDHLLQYGIDPAYQFLPVEYLLAKGILCDASTHVVFDSSLSYVIATSSHVTRDVDIVVGADLRAFESQQPGTIKFNEGNVEAQLQQERGVAPRSVSAGLKSISGYSRHYADALLNTVDLTELIDTDERSYFKIRVKR